jgi:hypothetical protein
MHAHLHFVVQLAPRLLHRNVVPFEQLELLLQPDLQSPNAHASLH